MMTIDFFLGFGLGSFAMQLFIFAIRRYDQIAMRKYFDEKYKDTRR